MVSQLAQKPTDLERYIYLISLLDHNETLFYRTVMSDPARFLPIVYEPTIGEACLKFGHIYRQPRGMYLSITQRGNVKEVLKNWPQKDVRSICVTDGGRILVTVQVPTYLGLDNSGRISEAMVDECENWATNCRHRWPC